MESAPSSEMLLAWSKEQTRCYGVNVLDFSLSWKDGLALCALIHSLDRSQYQYENLVYQPYEEVLRTTFETASKIGIPPLLDASDLTADVPDHTAIQSYLLSIYHHWQHVKAEKPPVKADHIDADQDVAKQTFDISDDIEKKGVHISNALRDSKEIKGLLLNVEEELTAIQKSIKQNTHQNKLAKSQISDKTSELENIIEKERLQFEREIVQLEKELEELKKKGPSDQQLALKRRLDEQIAKKDNLSRLKSKMEEEIEHLKLQLEHDVQLRTELQARRVQAEQTRAGLRQKHKQELQRLQQDLFDNLGNEDSLQTDLVHQNYVRTSLKTESNRITSEVKNLDNSHSSIAKQNVELKKKKQKLESRLLGAKLYLEEETRMLNFKELGKSDLNQQKKNKVEERERSYKVKRLKEKEHRTVTNELAGIREAYDNEYLKIKSIKRELGELESASDFLKDENEEEVQKRHKKLQQTKEAHSHKVEKEEHQYKYKVNTIVSQIDNLSESFQDAKAVLQIEQENIKEMQNNIEEMSMEARATTRSLEADFSSKKVASRTQDHLRRELERANQFLVDDKHNKTNHLRAKQRIEENIRSLTADILQAESKKDLIDQEKTYLVRDHELAKQDLKLADKDLKIIRDDRKHVEFKKETMAQEIERENSKPTTKSINNDNSFQDKMRDQEKELHINIDHIGWETSRINEKLDLLKLESSGLMDDKLALQSHKKM